MLRAFLGDGRRVALLGMSAFSPLLFCDSETTSVNVLCSRSFGTTTSMIGQHVPISGNSRRHISRDDDERCFAAHNVPGMTTGMVLFELSKEQKESASQLLETAPREIPSGSLTVKNVGYGTDVEYLLTALSPYRYWSLRPRSTLGLRGSGGFILASKQPLLCREYACLVDASDLTSDVQMTVSVQLDREGDRWKKMSTTNLKFEHASPLLSDKERDMKVAWVRGQVSVAEPVFGVKIEFSTSEVYVRVYQAKLFGVPITPKMAVDAVSPSWAVACGNPELASLLHSGSPDDMVKARIIVGTPTELTPTTWRQAGRLAHKAWTLSAVLSAVASGKLDAAVLKDALQHGYTPGDVSMVFEASMRAGTPANGAALKDLYNAGLLTSAQIDRLRVVACAFVSSTLSLCHK